MDRSEIEKRVKNIVKQQLHLKDKAVKCDSSLMYDLGADSLDIVELTFELESMFNINISDEDTEKFATINDIIRYIEIEYKE